jgi:superfamily II DNA/RNA helicase
VQRGVNALGFTRPTPVQAQAIPALCSGLDVLAEPPASSGKTCAFVAPALSMLNVALKMTQVLIIANTGPLANQTATVLDDLSKWEKRALVVKDLCAQFRSEAAEWLSSTSRN